MKPQRRRPWIRESTKEMYRLHGWRGIGHFLHGYYYLSHLDQYVKILLPVLRGLSKWLDASRLGAIRPVLAYVPDRYHGKITTLEDARKILMLDHDIAVDEATSRAIVPYEIANRIVIRNPGSIVVMDCACRHEKKNLHPPTDVCMIIGEPYATFALEHAKSLKPRRVSRQEALDILDVCHKKGWVHNAIFKDALGGQFFALCNCCKCCCGGLEVERIVKTLKLDDPIKIEASSGYLAVIDAEKCRACGVCVTRCPFAAVALEGEFAQINDNLCMGCGACTDSCPEDAIHLRLAPERGIPLDLDQLRQGVAGSTCERKELRV